MLSCRASNLPLAALLCLIGVQDLGTIAFGNASVGSSVVPQALALHCLRVYGACTSKLRPCIYYPRALRIFSDGLAYRLQHWLLIAAVP